MHFANKQYEFGNRNLLKLRLDLEQTDEASLQAFDFDLSSFDWTSYFDDYCLEYKFSYSLCVTHRL